MAKRQNFVVGSGNPVTESKTDAQLNVAWNQLEVLKAGDLDGIFKSVSFYGNDSSNEIANAILALTGSQPTGATETELGEAIKKALEDIQTTSLTFKGYISTTEPSSSTYTLKEGNLWINSSTMPTSFPVAASSIKVWSGSSWTTTTETYTAADFDFFRNINDSEGYYWFGGQWKTMSTDMSTTYFGLDSTGKWIINSTYDGSLVHKSGTETITGNKTFSGTNAFSGTTSFGANTTGVTAAVGDNSTKLATTAFVTAATAGGASDQSVVHKAGTETISGVKTFSALPVITATEAATDSKTDTAIPTKGWVNDPAKSTNVVHQDGTEEITGFKTFAKQIIQKNNYELDGSAHYNVAVDMKDKNGTTYGYLRTVYGQDNRTSCGVQAVRKIGGVEKYAEITVGFLSGGDTFSIAPTPKTNTTSSSTEIATVGWVNTAGVDSSGNNVNNIVHKTGDEIITGKKTFRGIHYLQNNSTSNVEGGELQLGPANTRSESVYVDNYYDTAANKTYGRIFVATGPAVKVDKNGYLYAENIIGAPDWQNAITLSNGTVSYTAPSNGWFCGQSAGDKHIFEVSMSINGTNRVLVGGYTGHWDSHAGMVPLKRGDVITYTTTTFAMFIPSK